MTSGPEGFEERFTAEEWLTLQLAPMWVIGIVASADGDAGEEEQRAGIRALSEAPLLAGRFAREVLMAAYENRQRLFAAMWEGGRRPDDGVRDAAALVERLDHAEAVLYKASLMRIGVRVAAAAAGEGGEIGRPEAAALAWLESWLGITEEEAVRVATGYGVSPEDSGDDRPGFYL
jgi:hypothetical protein